MSANLLRVAMEGNVEEVKGIIEGCNIQDINEIQDEEGRNALFCAACGGNLPVVQYLAENTSINLNAPDYSGSYVLIASAAQGYLHIVQYLVEKTAVNINEKTKEEGRTALHCAASEGHFSVVKYLAENSSTDVHACDNFGINAFLLAVSQNHVSIVKYFIENSIFDVNCKMTSLDQTVDADHRMNALHLAAGMGHLSMVKYLAENTLIDIKALEETGKNALECAEDFEEVKEFLTKYFRE